MGWLDIFVIMVLIIALAFGAYFFYNEIYNPAKSSGGYLAENQEMFINLPQQSKQFYPGMRFPEKKIAYNFADECDIRKKTNVRTAFSILDERTTLSFYESLEKGISVLCSKSAPKSEDSSHFIAGEGGPTKILNASTFYIIEGARIELFREERCENPNIALHEILHALGFDHNNNDVSIMYPVTSCKQEIDDSIINTINYLYNIESLPDMAISKINLNKTGRYMNFQITLNNYGLADYKDSILKVYADEEKIEEFEITNIELGHAKIFTATNVKAGGSTKVVRFEIVSKNNQRELRKDNNSVSISLSNE